MDAVYGSVHPTLLARVNQEYAEYVASTAAWAEADPRTKGLPRAPERAVDAKPETLYWAPNQRNKHRPRVVIRLSSGANAKYYNACGVLNPATGKRCTSKAREGGGGRCRIHALAAPERPEAWAVPVVTIRCRGAPAPAPAPAPALALASLDFVTKLLYCHEGPVASWE